MQDTLDLMPPRKRGGHGAPWLMSFADLVSLLFALFVLMLSMADINRDSFERNAVPMAQAFNQPAPTFAPRRDAVAPTPSAAPTDLRPKDVSQVRALAIRLRLALNDELRGGLVSLEEGETYAILRFPANSAFAVGSIDLRPATREILDRISEIVATTPGRVTVSGHTDNVPISTDRFRSNWDLSVARAVSVVHQLLVNRELLPNRVIATGSSDTNPIAHNETEDGRALNRRVEVRVDIPLAG